MAEEELYKQIENLEREKMEYLEVNDNAGAKRKEKKIEQIKLQIELLNLNKIKNELKAYKEVCRDYPDITARVKNKLEGEE